MKFWPHCFKPKSNFTHHWDSEKERKEHDYIISEQDIIKCESCKSIYAKQKHNKSSYSTGCMVITSGVGSSIPPNSLYQR